MNDLDLQHLHDPVADQGFLAAALAEDGMPISAGYAPPNGEYLSPAIDTQELDQALADTRFQEAALAEGGMPITAGWVEKPNAPRPSEALPSPDSSRDLTNRSCVPRSEPEPQGGGPQ